ncbi:MAG: heme-binding protein, partial [Pirellulales bacterium]
TLKPKLAHFPDAVRTRTESLYKLLEADSAEKSARLEELLTTLPSGDVRRGQAVFQGSKAACSACHAIGYLGGRVGPDLTRIAQIRSHRDLLEAIVFPSASLVRSYEPVLIATEDGKVLNGLIRQDNGQELVLATGPNQEVRVPRDTIEEMQQSSVSIMPAGLDKQLSPQQLADLLEFLIVTTK